MHQPENSEPSTDEQDNNEKSVQKQEHNSSLVSPEAGKGGKGKHPYDLCLQEIWEKTFEWLTDPNDLTSCLNACAPFNKLLQDKRVLFMFPEVFKIMIGHIGRKKKDHVDMLICRSVCKSWKEGVDNYYQTLPYFFEPDYYAFHEEALKCITAFLCRVWNDPFSTDFVLSPRGLSEMKKKLDVWNTILDKDEANPFPSRHLAIYDSEDTLRDDAEGLIENMEMKERVTEMLEKFGHHVHYFTVLLHMGIPSQRYLMLLNWLKYTPNLKVISLYFRAGDDDFGDIVEEHPFPEMSNLMVFQGDKVPNVVVQSVLKSNPQVEKIQNQGAPSLSPLRQPNLIQICVRSEKLGILEMDTAKFSRLENFSIDFHVAAEKAVEYSLCSNHSCKFNDFGAVGESFEIQLWKKAGESKNNQVLFTMLKRFEGTLVHFRLGLCDKAPKSKNIATSLSFNAVCIDVILPLRAWSMKSLHVSAKCRDGYRWMDEKDVINQLHTYLQGRLVESKIWKLPEVKQAFVVEGCDGYMTLFV